MNLGEDTGDGYPKETWTLISIIIYAIIIHLKYIKGLMSEYLLSLINCD